jgi:hypothetical protein
MKYGEKDQSWRTTGRVRSVEVDHLGRVSIEQEVHFLKEPGAEHVMGRLAGRGLPGWVAAMNPAFMGSGVSAGDGHGRVVLRYKGMTTPPSAPGDNRPKEDREKEISVEVSMERTPLTMHPKIDYFLSSWGGTFDGNEIKWVEQNPVNDFFRKRTGVTKDGKEIENINPFYGLQDYLEVGVIARVSEPIFGGFGVGSGGALAKVGKVSMPPPQIPAAPKGKNWLCIEAEEIRQGRDSVQRQAWQLSGIGGWEPLIYDPKNAASEARSGGEEAGEGGGGGGGE